MNSVHKVEEWKRRCAEPPPTLRAPELRMWTSEQQRHRETVRSCQPHTRTEKDKRHSAEMDELSNALHRAQKFRAAQQQTRLRQENARLVQKLADVAHRSMVRQAKLAKTPPPPQGSTLNEPFRRRTEDMINAENMQLLRRLESAVPAIVSNQSAQGSFRKHLMLRQRLLKWKRNSRGDLNPLPGLSPPRTAPARLTNGSDNRHPQPPPTAKPKSAPGPRPKAATHASNSWSQRPPPDENFDESPKFNNTQSSPSSCSPTGRIELEVQQDQQADVFDFEAPAEDQRRHSHGRGSTSSTRRGTPPIAMWEEDFTDDGRRVAGTPREGMHSPGATAPSQPELSQSTAEQLALSEVRKSPEALEMAQRSPQGPLSSPKPLNSQTEQPGKAEQVSMMEREPPEAEGALPASENQDLEPEPDLFFSDGPFELDTSSAARAEEQNFAETPRAGEKPESKAKPAENPKGTPKSEEGSRSLNQSYADEFEDEFEDDEFDSETDPGSP